VFKSVYLPWCGQLAAAAALDWTVGSTPGCGAVVEGPGVGVCCSGACGSGLSGAGTGPDVDGVGALFSLLPPGRRPGLDGFTVPGFGPDSIVPSVPAPTPVPVNVMSTAFPPSSLGITIVAVWRPTFLGEKRTRKKHDPLSP
jgi:hypothetical protein